MGPNRRSESLRRAPHPKSGTSDSIRSVHARATITWFWSGLTGELSLNAWAILVNAAGRSDPASRRERALNPRSLRRLGGLLVEDDRMRTVGNDFLRDEHFFHGR